jgi:hypothetical protein
LSKNYKSSELKEDSIPSKKLEFVDDGKLYEIEYISKFKIVKIDITKIDQE